MMAEYKGWFMTIDNKIEQKKKIIKTKKKNFFN